MMGAQSVVLPHMLGKTCSLGGMQSIWGGWLAALSQQLFFLPPLASMATFVLGHSVL